jgi:hypothetical protein
MKKNILILSMIVLFINARAEIGKGDIYAGFGFNGTAYLTEGGLSSGIGLNFRGGLNFHRKIGIVIGFNQSFPVTFKSTQYAYAFSSLTDPSEIEYVSTKKVKFYDISVHANFYMVGTADDGFGFYGHVGGGILGYDAQVDHPSYDKSLYWSMEQDDSSIGIMLGAGLGLQYRSGILGGFLEFGANVPVTEVNDQAIEPIALINAGLTLGVKVHFGKSKRN